MFPWPGDIWHSRPQTLEFADLGWHLCSHIISDPRPCHVGLVYTQIELLRCGAAIMITSFCRYFGPPSVHQVACPSVPTFLSPIHVRIKTCQSPRWLCIPHNVPSYVLTRSRAIADMRRPSLCSDQFSRESFGYGAATFSECDNGLGMLHTGEWYSVVPRFARTVLSSKLCGPRELTSRLRAGARWEQLGAQGREPGWWWRWWPCVNVSSGRSLEPETGREGQVQ